MSLTLIEYIITMSIIAVIGGYCAAVALTYRFKECPRCRGTGVYGNGHVCTRCMGSGNR